MRGLRREARRALRAAVLVVLALASAAGAASVGRAAHPQAAPLPGLESQLERVALAAAAGVTADALREARRGGLTTSGDRVEVVVRARPGQRALATTALTARGGAPVRSYGGLVKALVPVAELASLARAAGVERVEAPQRFHAAAVTGEGVAASNAAVVQGDGARGAGVKIGIVDAGFGQHELRQSAGELPAGQALKTKNFCNDFGQHLHGTAVAEIVHEVAPAAELHLICIEDVVDMGAAADYAIENGIHIVNESGGFLNTSRGDGSGGPDTPDGIVARARAAGVLWVASAGNAAKYHWAGAFADADGDGLAEFAPGDEGNDFATKTGELVCAYLKWDAWPATALDYDLLLRSSAGAVLGGSSSAQTGTQPPTEAFCFSPAAEETFSLGIRGPPGSTALRFDVFLVASARGTLQHATAAGSLIEPASGPQALAAATACWQSGEVASYSSRGPVIGGGVKPDLTGFDSVSSATYGSFSTCEKSGFTGTSAAAPHVVGAAAILKQLQPGYGPAELQAQLEAWAADVGPAGKDTASGAGRLRLAVRPTPATSRPASVGRRTAVLAGTVEAHRWSGRAFFELSREAGFAAPSTSAAVPFEAGAAAVPISAPVDGLEPTTTYYVRLVAENEHGTRRAAATTFTTAAASAPAVGIAAPTNRGQSGVTLNGSVNANNAAATHAFEYGPSAAFGASTAPGTVGGDTTQPVSATLTGLTPGTLYHYRLVATNGFGSTVSSTGTFRTLPNVPPTVVTGTATSVEATHGSVSGVVSPGGNATTYWVEFGPSAALGASAAGGTIPADDAAHAVSATLAGLAPGTAYHYRLVALNAAGGPVAGEVRTFTTAAPPPPPPPPAPPAAPPPPVPVPLPVAPPASNRPDAVVAPSGRTWRGSNRANVVTGGSGADRLDGRGGADRLFGRGGADVLTGGPGRDVLDGGAGNDRILARDGTRDVVRCGSGRDTVVADRVDAVARDCELVRRR